MLQDDNKKLQDLLHRTGEFVAYFEVAEEKMHSWRYELDARMDVLHSQLSEFQEMQQATGLSELKQIIQKAQTATQVQMQSLQTLQKQNREESKNHYQQLEANVNKLKNDMDEHIQQSINKIDEALSQYDLQHFHRIANESCDHVERVAQDAVNKSTKVLGYFQWRIGFLAVVATIVTSLVMGLYVSDEWPWEMHQHARNERQAGQLLLQAWPQLSHQEKLNILKHESIRRS